MFNEKKKMPYIFILLFCALSLLSALALGVMRKGFPIKEIAACVGAVLIMLAPLVLESAYGIGLTQGWQVMFAAFVFASMCLGTALNFYALFPWWDIALHSVSGAIICVGAFYLFRAFEGRGGGFFGAVAFGFCFTLALGVFWEFYEFFGDMLFGANMQNGVYLEGLNAALYTNRFGRIVDPALFDTMKDMLMNTLGAFVGALWLFGKRALGFGTARK